MLRPRIHAPTLAKPRAAKSSSTPVAPPSLPSICWKVRVGKTHSCSAVAADAERVVEALVRAGAEAVDGNAEAADDESGHGRLRHEPQRPYFAVKLALASWLAWIMKPISAALASAGASSLSVFSA